MFTELLFTALLAQAPSEATLEDHRDMMRQLGITALRPGPSGRAGAPNPANYDEALANPFPKLPPLLRLENGKAVKTRQDWERQRRPELIEIFEREVIGRVPAGIPPVEWEEVGREGATRKLVGRVGPVEMAATLTLPAHARRPAPVMILFTFRGANPQAVEELTKAGWGYATLAPNSVQADHGAGLTSGIIGLTNEGRRRKPEDWGALRAWAWGASRLLDYLETVPEVDARRVGIEGVSRYGKAALVAMAMDQRFAVALVGSSGEGGAKLHRRNFGEAVENLTAAGEYHWMAGNFLKYGAAEASFGSRNAGDIPVDAHQLIALCAPRPVFISYGIPEKGDALWLDQRGSFLAAVAAGPAWRLYGAKDLGTATMPAVNEGLLDGALAWRQHDGGHTDGPNWQHFVPWAERMLGMQGKKQE